MVLRRLLVALALGVGVVVAVTPVHCTRGVMPVSTPCDAGALSSAFRGPLKLVRLDNYGCQGTWAFAWATIGHGNDQVGVTEVLHFHQTTSRWGFASRAVVCVGSTLPSRINRLGCHSN
ncbi:MAG: hypothetical protein KGL79_08795 [Acidobacteriota bacterium]|nr:hypothetical protein [Acidobacteriota bacterium]